MHNTTRQFFLGDYRPLTQDTHGNVVDQETQLSPYLRNIQDTLCDSSMLPYPEPYQTMYQRRRLGALGIEWRPSHIKFATGTDTGMGQDIPPLPLPDLDVVEPLPDYGDAIFWEPENDAINDDNDSEYNANEEVFSEELNKCSDNTSGSECGEGDNDKQTQKDYTRRSKRRKYAEVESTSDIRTKNRNKDGKEGTSSRATTYTKSKLVLRSSGTQPSKLKSLRPQRAAARSDVSSFSNSAETSLDEEEDEFSMSESDSDLSLEDEERSEYLANKRSFGAVRSAPNGFEDLNSLRQPGPQISGGNQKRLVFKFSRNQKSAPMSSDNRVDQVTEPSSSLWSCEDNLVQKIVDSGSRNLDSSSASMHGKEPLENCRRRTEDEERTLLDRNQCIASTSSGVANVRWGRIKIRMPNSSISGASIPVESTTKTSDTCQPTWVEDNVSSAVSPHCGEQLKDDGSAIIGHTFDRSTGSPSNHDGIKLHIVDKHSSQMSNSAQKKRNVIKIKSTKISGDTTSQFKPKATSGSGSDAAMECQAASLTRNSSELLDIATDSANRTTLHKKKCTKQDFGLAANNLDSRDDHLKSNSCIDREMFVKDDDCFLSGGSNRGDYNCRESSYFVETNKHAMPGISNWLSLTGQEGGYRYIPQLGDQVVYLKQGHKDFIVRTQPTQHDNGLSYGDSLRAVESCSVDDLDYASHTGSGASCCQITLKLIDPKCRVYGKKIQLTLPELDDFPDFIVEKMWYDATMERNWSVGEKCLVWWRDNTEQAGSWWEGQITAIKDKDSKFPGSPWERYLVQYETDAEIHHHSPWELHGSEGQWEQPTIDSKIKESILSSFNKLFRRAYNNKDSYGVIKLNEASLKMDFVNRFPVPLSLDVIKTRLENDYYRSIIALKHDFKVMMSNAESYFHKSPGVLRKIKHLEAWFSEIFTLL